MKFDVITLFPKVFEDYLKESILGRAVKKGLIEINVHNLRDYSEETKHRKVDERSYGGGPGMVLKPEPIIKAVESVKKKNRNKKTKVILFSASGREFNDNSSIKLNSRYNHLILIAGHYEGIDERVKRALKAEEVSIGSYVLSGGELPAMILIDAVSRKVKGVLGKSESLEEKRLGVGVPVYTRPEVFIYRGKKYKVPKVLLSGNHKAITSWRISHKKSG